MKKILVIHGPNLDLLGTREPGVYGKVTLKQINADLKKAGRGRKVFLTIVQSNHEGRIVDLIGKGKVKSVPKFVAALRRALDVQ
jgi:3-dehydroquinate dehydratase-2